MGFASLLAVGAVAIASWSEHASALLFGEKSAEMDAKRAQTELEEKPWPWSFPNPWHSVTKSPTESEEKPRPWSFPNPWHRAVTTSPRPKSRVTKSLWPGPWTASSETQRPKRRDVLRAQQCLRLTTPGLTLHYPADAEQHVEEIMRAMRPWNSGFVGTFHVEDIWNIVVADMWFNRTNKADRLSKFFGPYIPIFTQFVHPWYHSVGPDDGPMHYPLGFVAALRSVLRTDVPYAAVSQNAEGLVAHGELRMSEFPNVLVLSAGGYGHVALPLLKTAGKTLLLAKQDFDSRFNLQAQRKQVGQRKYFVSFVGTIGHSPRNMRQEMKKVAEDFPKSHDTHGRGMAFEYFVGPQSTGQWESIMLESRFSLVPRGYGRTSYHLAETISMGLIPIFVYTDQPWVPYPELYKTFGYSTTVSGLPRLLEKLNAMSDSEIAAREGIVAAVAKSHFTHAGVIKQMKAFLLGGPTDLVCQKLPDSTTDMGTLNWAGDPAM